MLWRPCGSYRRDVPVNNLEAYSRGYRRKPGSRNLTIQVSDEFFQKLDALAAETGMSKCAIGRMAIAEFLIERAYSPKDESEREETLDRLNKTR